MDAREALDVVDVLVEVGHRDDARLLEPAGEQLDVAPVPGGQHVVVAEILGHALGQLVAQLRRELGGHVTRVGVAEQVMVDAVDDHPAEGHARGLELAPEVDGLLDRLALGRGDEEEHGLRIGQEPVDLDRALLEPVDHPADGAEEHREVLEEVDAGHPLEHPEYHPGAPAHHPGGEAGGAEEDLQGTALEELGQPVGGVEDEQVEVVRLVELVELGDGRVLLRAGHGARELLVDPVLQHLGARLLIGRQLFDDLVEGALGVEHHGPQLALHLEARGLEELGVHEVGLVAQLLQAQGVGEPPGGIDRDHRHLAALRRRAHGDRRGGRRLPDAAGPAADADALALERLRDVHSAASRRSDSRW